MSLPRQQLALVYGELLDDIFQPLCAAEDFTEAEEEPIRGELEIQELWHAGMLGAEGETQRHGRLRVLDFGE